MPQTITYLMTTIAQLISKFKSRKTPAAVLHSVRSENRIFIENAPGIVPEHL
jgi:hypothetical protein